MIPSFKTILERVVCKDVCAAWVFCFGHCEPVPKNFEQLVPQLADLRQLFTFPSIDTKIIKKKIMKMGSSDEIRATLKEEFGLGVPVDRACFKITSRRLNFKGLNAKTMEMLFGWNLRFFCQLAEQIDEILREALSGTEVAVETVGEIGNMFKFFQNFNELKSFNHFIATAKCIMTGLAKVWDKLIDPIGKPVLMSHSTRILCAMIVCMRIGDGKAVRIDPYFANYVINHLLMTIHITERTGMTVDALRQILGVFTELISIIRATNAKNRADLSPAAIHLLTMVTRLDSIPCEDRARGGSLCMMVDSECVMDSPEEVMTARYAAIAKFVVWVIQHFPVDPMPKEGDFEMTRDAFAYHGKDLNPVLYLKEQPVMRFFDKLPVGRGLMDVTAKISLIIQHTADPGNNVACFVRTMTADGYGLNAEGHRVLWATVLQVLIMTSPQIVSVGMANVWSKLLCEYVYPCNPWTIEDCLLRDASNYLLYKCATKEGPPFLAALNGIASYVRASGNDESVYHFVPLFIQLLRDIKEIRFIETLIRSPLLSLTLKLSHEDENWFNFARMLAYIDPFNALSQAPFTGMLSQAFFDETKRSSTVLVFANALALPSTDPHHEAARRNVLAGVVSIIQRCVAKSSLFVVDIFPVLETSAPRFTAGLLEYCRRIIFFETIATIGGTFDSLYMRSIQLLSTMAQQNTLITEVMRSDDAGFYSILKTGIERRVVAKGCIPVFIGMALGARPVSGERGQIRNHRAIELLLVYAKYVPDEEMTVLQMLMDFAEQQHNLYELGKDTVMSVIIQRIGEVREDEPLFAMYTRLFRIISDKTFSRVGLNKVVGLMKSGDVSITEHMMGLFNEVLSDTHAIVPSCHFNFDGQGTGISLAQFPVKDWFTVCFSVRPQWTTATGNTTQPLLTIMKSDNDVTMFYFREGKLYLKRQDDVDGTEFPGTFTPGRWYFVCVTVAPRGYTVTIDKEEPAKLEVNLSIPGNLTFHFGTRYANAGMRAMIADFSSIFVFKGTETKLIEPGMHRSALPPGLDSSLLFCLNPADAQDSRVFKVSTKIPSVEFRGKVTPMVATMRDVLMSAGGLMTILPLFTCLFDNSRSTEIGIRLCSDTFRIVGRILALSEMAQAKFMSTHGFELMAGFIDRVADKYVTEAMLDDLLGLFSVLPREDMRIEMIKSTWLNFDLVRKFDAEQQPLYFSIYMTRAFDMYKDLFWKSKCMDFAVYQAVTVFHEASPVGSTCWQFMRIAMHANIDNGATTALLAAAVTHVSDFASYHAVSSFKYVCERFRINDHVDPNYAYSALLQLLKYTKLQNICFQTMDTMRSRFSSKCFRDAMVQATRVFVIEDVDEALKVVAEHMYDERGAIIGCDYVPLYLRCATMLDTEDRKRIALEIASHIHEFKDEAGQIVLIDFWYISLLSFLESASLTERQIAEIYADIIGTGMSKSGVNTSLTSLFDFLSLKKGDYRSLKREILMRLFEDRAAFVLCVKPVFEYICFQPVEYNGATTFHLVLDIDKSTGDWKDLQVAVGLLDLDDTGDEMDDYVYLMIAYIIACTVRFGNDKHVSRVTNMNCDLMISYQAVAIVSCVAEKMGKSYYDESDVMFDDDSDSAAYQNYVFEEAMLLKMKGRMNQHNTMKAAFTAARTKTSEVVKEWAARFSWVVQKFKFEQQLRFAGNQALRSKRVTSFMSSFCTEPWRVTEDSDLKLKYTSVLGRHGRRSVLKPTRALERVSTDRVWKPVKPSVGLVKEPFTVNARVMTIAEDYDGIVAIREETLFFDGVSGAGTTKRIQVPLSKIEFVFTRMFAGDDVACEVFTSLTRSYFIVFADNQRSFFYERVNALSKASANAREEKKFDFFACCRRVCGSVYQTLAPGTLTGRLRLTELWQSYTISMYRYIYYLNVIAGRSFNVTSLYPIFPWVLNQTSGEVLDFSDLSIYRDMKSPAQALSTQRTTCVAQGMSADENRCQWMQPHLSSSDVSRFLAGVEPFSGSLTFTSIPNHMKDLYDGSVACESVPEFFGTADFLSADVALPQWARDAGHFAAVNRQILEGNRSSEHMNKWIDLVFGIRNETGACYTRFHSSLYSGKELPPEQVQDRRDRMCTCGSIPLPLFSSEHPARGSPRRVKTWQSVHVNDDAIVSMCKQVILCNPPALVDLRRSNAPKRDLPKSGYGNLWAVSRSLGLAVLGTGTDQFVSIVDVTSGALRTVSHDNSLVSCAAVVGGDILITGGSDGSVAVWKLATGKRISISCLHDGLVAVVAACAEIGLLVSVDRKGSVVFETLFDNKLIRAIQIRGARRVEVMKSGTVLVVAETPTGSELIALNARGDELRRKGIPGAVTEFARFYDFDSREFIFIGYEPGAIRMIDVATFDILATQDRNGQRARFCLARGPRGLLVSGGNKITWIDFAVSIRPGASRTAK